MRDRESERGRPRRPRRTTRRQSTTGVDSVVLYVQESSATPSTLHYSWSDRGSSPKYLSRVTHSPHVSRTVHDTIEHHKLGEKKEGQRENEEVYKVVEVGLDWNDEVCDKEDE